MPTQKPTGRPRGAPKGNRNALKHGLYARRYSTDQRKDLKAMPLLDSTSEIYMLRTQLNDILTLIAAAQNEDHKVKLYNTLFTGVQRLLASMRTYHKLIGESDPFLSEFDRVLAEVQEELGLRNPMGEY